jgi:Skp family chaperone for outer membrane proteins
MRQSWWVGLAVGVVFGAVLFTAISGLYAQHRGGLSTGRIACLDVVRIFNEYDRQKDLEEEMKAFRDELQNEMERRKGGMDKLQATLDALSDDDPTKVKRHREMLALQLDYRNWTDLMQADMAREIAVWNTRTYGEILAATEELALREGYDVVLYMTPPQLIGADPEAIKEQIRARKLVYANPALDITQAVLDRLNANYRAQPKTRMLQISPTLGP